MIRLHDAAGLKSVSEQTVLPFECLQTGEGEVVFPEQTESLVPVRLGARVLDTPRFSLFSAPEACVAGFRLFRIDDRYATDSSLVGDPDRSTEIFNQKLSSGQRENIPEAPEFGSNARNISIDGEVLLACSDEPSNFGSWMYRILPKILLATKARVVDGIFVYSSHGWMKAILETVGFGGQIIHHDPSAIYRVRNAVIPSLPAPHAYLRPEIREALLSLHDRAPSSASLGEKLYISRRSQAIKRHGFRVLENETAVVERLVERGFSEFIPENYSFKDQIAIFGRAKVIVGCGGSNMFGCLLARNAEFIVDLESCDDWIFAHRNIMSSTGASFSIVRGLQKERGNRWHRNWVIDDDALLSGLGKLGLA